MSVRRGVLCLVLALLGTGASHALEAKALRIRAAVTHIVAVHHDQGEQAAIEALRACYLSLYASTSLPQLKALLKAEECVAQDIGYANFSAGFYRNVLKGQSQPLYVGMPAMKARVFEAAGFLGLNAADSEGFLRAVASDAIDSLVPAVQALARSRR